jgi:hypothetical protein
MLAATIGNAKPPANNASAKIAATAPGASIIVLAMFISNISHFLTP